MLMKNLTAKQQQEYQNDNSVEQLHDRAGYDVVMPTLLLMDKEIGSNLKQFYGVVRNLMRVKGYCWASDETLGSMFGVSRRTIQNWLKVLEQKHYLHRETFNANFRKTRRIWLHESYTRFKKSHTKEPDFHIDPDPGEKSPPGQNKEIHTTENDFQFACADLHSQAFPLRMEIGCLTSASHKLTDSELTEKPTTEPSAQVSELSEFGLSSDDEKKVRAYAKKKGLTSLQTPIAVLREYEKRGDVQSRTAVLMAAIRGGWSPTHKKSDYKANHKKIALDLQQELKERMPEVVVMVTEDAILINPGNSGNVDNVHQWTFYFSDGKFISKCKERLHSIKQSAADYKRVFGI